MLTLPPACGMFLLAFGALSALIPSTIEAQRDGAPAQVIIEPRVVEISTEITTNLGLSWDNLKGSYSSSGSQAAGRDSSAGTFGSAGGGLNLWFSPTQQPTPTGAIAIGAPSFGAGVGVNGYFGASQMREILKLTRHHPGQNTIDVIGEHGLDWTVDLNARVRVPILSEQRAPASGDRIVPLLMIDLFVGPSIVGSRTSLNVDQTFFGGTNEKVTKTNVNVVPNFGGGISKQLTTTKIPLLGEIPIIGRLFHSARRMPGSSVSKPSSFGFVEKFRTDPNWQNETKLELIFLIKPTITRSE